MWKLDFPFLQKMTFFIKFSQKWKFSKSEKPLFGFGIWVPFFNVLKNRVFWHIFTSKKCVKNCKNRKNPKILKSKPSIYGHIEKWLKSGKNVKNTVFYVKMPHIWAFFAFFGVFCQKMTLKVLDLFFDLFLTHFLMKKHKYSGHRTPKGPKNPKISLFGGFWHLLTTFCFKNCLNRVLMPLDLTLNQKW